LLHTSLLQPLAEEQIHDLRLLPVRAFDYIDREAPPSLR
jgi:hypothetical protein